MIENMQTPSYTSEKPKFRHDGWDERIFQWLSEKNQEAYTLAAELHHGAKRKDGQPYLVHINRSIALLETHRKLIPTNIYREVIEFSIILHDCIEDHTEGLERIYEQFGDDIAIRILWMSALKKGVRWQVQGFLAKRTDEIGKQNPWYWVFRELAQLIEYNHPTDNGVQERLQQILPKGYWIDLWEEGFRERYETAPTLDEQNDVFADWVFQGMIANMSDREFFAKTLERLDNLGDTAGLQKNEKWLQSYKKTIFTTNNVYFPRLETMHAIWLIQALNHAKVDWVFRFWKSTGTAHSAVPDSETDE